MNSIFTPIINEGFTTLRVRYNWKTGLMRMEMLKEWDVEQDFSKYNKNFYYEEILTEDPKYLNNQEVLDIYEKYDLSEYLSDIINLIKKDRHFGVDFYYNAKLDIKFMCHKHSRKMGCNNKRHATFLDGIRRYEPEDDEYSIIRDCLEISRGMSYKIKAANLSYGGSKTALQMPPIDLDDMQVMGFIAYAFDKSCCMTGADMKVPTEIADVMNDYFSMNFVCGPNSKLGISGVPTAYGVHKTLETAVEFKEGCDLTGKSAVVIGLGAVGWSMAEHMLESGIRLSISDINEELVKKFIDAHLENDINVVPVEEAIYSDVDIVSPCAVGGIIRSDNIDDFKCKYIWGSANGQIFAMSQTEEFEIARKLQERGITFQPEWWYNTGGVICAAFEYENGDSATYEGLIEFMDNNLPQATLENLQEAEKNGITPTENVYRLCNAYIYGE